MILRLIKRPVAVTMCVIALTVVCILSLRGLPVSLMPDIDIPRITVNVPMPGASVREVETRVAAPLRGQAHADSRNKGDQERVEDRRHDHHDGVHAGEPHGSSLHRGE